MQASIVKQAEDVEQLRAQADELQSRLQVRFDSSVESSGVRRKIRRHKHFAVISFP